MSWSRMACGMIASVLAIAIATAITALRATGSLGHVGQQRELTRPLDGPRDLVLVATTCASDPTGPDLPALGDEAPKGGKILVVDLVHLIAAIRTRLPATGS